MPRWSQPRRSVRPALALAALALLAGAACREAAVPADPPLPVGTEVGERAPPLSGTTAGGGPYTLAAAGATGTVVVFYRSYHCGLCRERLRELQAHLPQYEAVGARVVAVTADPPAEVQRAVEELGLAYPVVGVDSATLAAWGVVDTAGSPPLPASYLVDRRGVVVFRHLGRNAADRASDIEILAALQQLRGGRG